jgi:transcriptional adapter 2-alpha
MPGRLEFEHEVDNEAEMVVKDFDFGLVWKYGGDEQPQAKVTKASGDDDVEEEEEEDGEGKANEAQKNGKVSDPDIEPGVKVDPQEIKVKQEPKDLPQPEASSSQSPIRKEAGSQSPSKKGKEKEVVEPEQEVEDDAELEVKLALLDIYFSKLDKREEAKDLIFDRGLTEYKRVSEVSTIQKPY